MDQRDDSEDDAREERLARAARAWKRAIASVPAERAAATAAGLDALVRRIAALPPAERAMVRAALRGVSVADACARAGRQAERADYERRARALEKAGLGAILGVSALEGADLR